MGLDDKRLLDWLSQLDESELVLGDNQHSTLLWTLREKHIPETRRASRRRADQSTNLRQSRLELETFDQPRLPARPRTADTGSKISRLEKNGYERIPRAKTKEDRYDYKGNESRVHNRRNTTTVKKKASKQKRKHTINAEFHASNVPPDRLTLHPATNLGIFNKGKRSSPVKTRVLEHAFSETQFLNKGPMHEKSNTVPQPLNSWNMFDHVSEPAETPRRTGPRLLESVVEGAAQKQSPRPSDDLHRTNTAMNTVPEICCPQKSITEVACKHPSSRDKKQEPREGPTVSAQEKQNMAMDEDQYTMQLLNFDLNSPERGVTEFSDKYQLTLEDLKSLMQQRMSAWRSEDDSGRATLARSQQGSRKRKRTSSQDEVVLDKNDSRKRKVDNYGQRPHDEVTNSITRPQAPILDFDSLCGGCVDHPIGDPLPNHGQSNEAVEENIWHPPRPFVDNGPSLLHGDETFLISQAFDAAYEAIMRSEHDVPFVIPEYAPTGIANMDTGEGRTVPSLQGPREWSLTKEATLDPLQFEQEIFPLQVHSKDSAAYIPRAGCYDQQLYLMESHADREPLRSIGQNAAWSSRRASGRDGSETNSLDLEVGDMKNFWRQNKLY
ncbi:hypothetical protein BDV18DRAFT_53585 [Aspergillus unguis]